MQGNRPVTFISCQSDGQPQKESHAPHGQTAYHAVSDGGSSFLPATHPIHELAAVLLVILMLALSIVAISSSKWSTVAVNGDTTTAGLFKYCITYNSGGEVIPLECGYTRALVKRFQHRGLYNAGVGFGGLAIVLMAIVTLVCIASVVISRRRRQLGGFLLCSAFLPLLPALSWILSASCFTAYIVLALAEATKDVKGFAITVRFHFSYACCWIVVCLAIVSLVVLLTLHKRKAASRRQAAQDSMHLVQEQYN